MFKTTQAAGGVHSFVCFIPHMSRCKECMPRRYVYKGKLQCYVHIHTHTGQCFTNHDCGQKIKPIHEEQSKGNM
jgi:hypothetical protein